MVPFHPELRSARFLPTFNVGPRIVRFVQGRSERMKGPVLPAGVSLTVLEVPGPAGAPKVILRILRPQNDLASLPALLWIHGGGYLIGNPIQDEAVNAQMVLETGVVIAAVKYRLGPENPYPAGIEDCYAGLKALFERADELRLDRTRIGIGGASAGGGLASALALLARDRGKLKVAFQSLVYPMLDDRTVLRTDVAERNLRIWHTGSNRFGWTSYLGKAPGSADVGPYEAAARAKSLAGLPPAWIGVGTKDLFHDEDVAYAGRLEEAGVPCELVIVPGAFHGFDAFAPKSKVVQEFRASEVRAIRQHLVGS